MNIMAVPDYYGIDELLASEDRAVRDRVRAFTDSEVVPIINHYWEKAEFPYELVPKLAELGVVGGTIDGYGCPGLSPLAVGLTHMELERGDGSFNTFHGIQSGLVMGAIATFGSEEQKSRWLPAMARLDAIGAFAMTEPNHGSDVFRLETTARRTRDGWVINGKKRWIGNGSIADVIIVWARDEDGHVGGFLVENGASGLSTEVITGKLSKRAVLQADVTLNGVRVDSHSRLPGARTFRDIAAHLTVGRHNVAWQAIGHALAAYEGALSYALERHQFSQPIAAFQLVQQKLAHMLMEIVPMQLMCIRMSQLLAEGRLTPAVASLAKMNNAAKARAITGEARDILGGNGILLENHIARHQADVEAVYTYEGTDNIHTLIVGREITGIPAFE